MPESKNTDENSEIVLNNVLKNINYIIEETASVNYYVPRTYRESLSYLRSLYYINSTHCLTHLNVSNISLTEIHDAISEFKNLQHFDASMNELTVFPKGLTKLPKLKTLNLYLNKIEVIPEEIQYITSLKKFDCSFNKIKIIGHSIRFLTSLKHLNCSYNQITNIKFIEYLTNLRTFDCSNNKEVLNIPDELIKLTKLEKLYVHPCNANMKPELKQFVLKFDVN